MRRSILFALLSAAAVLVLAGPGAASALADGDLFVTKSGPSMAGPGEDVTYTITVANAGPDPAANAQLTDTLPAGMTFVSLTQESGMSWNCPTPAVGAGGAVTCANPTMGAGQSATFTLVAHVESNVPSGAVLSNVASVSSTSDPNEENDTSTVTTTIASADLSTTVAASPDPVTAGEDLTYTVTVDNDGPDTAAGASLSDTLPPGTTFVSLTSPGGWSCTTPAVGSGGTIGCTNAALASSTSTFTLTVRVDPDVTDGSGLSNTATVASATSDPNPGNDSATEATTVATSADLVTAIAAPPGPVSIGDEVTYAVTVAQDGPSDAQDVALELTLPGAGAFRSLTAPAGWTCTTPAVGATGGTATCTRASLAAGSTGDFTLVLRTASLPPGNALSLTAVASSTTADPSPGDATATATTSVASPPPAPSGPALFPPTVVSVSPATGGPGTAVTISGAGFAGTSQVLFGHTPAAGYVVDSHQRITAVVPAGLWGTVDVRVVNPLGMSPIAPGARFTADPPPPLAPVTPAAPAASSEQRPAADCRMPELTGHTLQGARRMLRRHGCHVRLRHGGRGRHGRAHVRAQRPDPGTILRRGQVVRVRVR